MEMKSIGDDYPGVGLLIWIVSVSSASSLALSFASHTNITLIWFNIKRQTDQHRRVFHVYTSLLLLATVVDDQLMSLSKSSLLKQPVLHPNSQLSRSAFACSFLFDPV